MSCSCDIGNEGDALTHLLPQFNRLDIYIFPNNQIKEWFVFVHWFLPLINSTKSNDEISFDWTVETEKKRIYSIRSSLLAHESMSIFTICLSRNEFNRSIDHNRYLHLFTLLTTHTHIYIIMRFPFDCCDVLTCIYSCLLYTLHHSTFYRFFYDFDFVSFPFWAHS